ncbi:MAG: PAS domain S-box protein [Roseiflexaceae bacterium]
MSLPTFLPNGHNPPVSYAAFRTYLEAERPALVKTLAREVTAQLPSYRTLSEDAPEQRIEQNIDAYLAGLDDPAQLIAWTQGQLGPVLIQTVELDGLLQVAALYRQQFMQLGLRALMDGVEGAAQGLAKLMDLLDLRVRLFVQFYQERLQLLETLIENALDGISVTNFDGECLYCNSANARALGYTDRSQMIGSEANKAIAPEEEARMITEIVPQVMRDGIWQGQLWGRRIGGSRFRMRNAIVLLRDAQGNPSALAGYMRDISSEYEAEQSLKRQAAELQTFYALAENAPDGVLVASIEGEISYTNTAMRTLLGFGNDPMSGIQVLAQLDAPPALLEEISVEIGANGSWQGPLNYRRRDGSIVRCQASSFLIQIGDSAVIASVVRDLTAQQLAEQERIALQDQVIAAQQAALRELSTPLIPLADHVVAMPLIGSIDSARAQQIIEELLTGVAANRATTAIIDITGVPIVDTQVAGALLRAAQAVELLGSRVVITGIRPEVAQTLVGIGVNLGNIVTRATLQDGIAYALLKK